MNTIEVRLSAKLANSIIAKSAELLKSSKEDIKKANAAYTSLSQVLKDMQRSLTDYRPVLESLGYSRTLKPSEMRAAMESVGLVKEDKDGQPQMAFVRKSVRRNEDGSFILDAAGEKTYTYDLAIIKSWSPSKVLKALAQVKATAAVTAEEAATAAKGAKAA